MDIKALWTWFYITRRYNSARPLSSQVFQNCTNVRHILRASYVRNESVRDLLPLEKQTFWQMVIFDLCRPPLTTTDLFRSFLYIPSSLRTRTLSQLNFWWIEKKWFWWWKAGGEWFSTFWNYNWHIWHCHWQFWKLFHHSCIHQVRYQT